MKDSGLMGRGGGGKFKPDKVIYFWKWWVEETQGVTSICQSVKMPGEEEEEKEDEEEERERVTAFTHSCSL
ncbi:hypothetical protein E2C01_036741 [Portunus trituberculatus]|uniref:Uncharacterized protein n=1 Tax=Portunus trituberculatus TaxID=210409 RepID=A0A5B7FF56_PORTR|nr:hypothetical protein [Portunus trituberculatus]